MSYVYKVYLKDYPAPVEVECSEPSLSSVYLRDSLAGVWDLWEITSPEGEPIAWFRSSETLAVVVVRQPSKE